MTAAQASWRKSSFSSQEGDCVELHSQLDRIRDSKHPAEELLLGRAAIAALTATVTRITRT